MSVERPPETIPELVERGAARYGSAVALRRFDESERYRELSYRELAARQAHVAARLRAAGLVPGDRVVVMGQNGPEWVAGALGTLAARCVVVPVDAKAKDPEVRAIVGASGARGMLVEPGGAIGEAALCDVAFVLGDRDGDLAAVEGPGPSEPDGERPRASDLALIVYTSGTTGASKGVMLTHGNVLSNVEGSCSSMGLTPDDSLLSVLPLSHMLEFTAGFLCPLRHGCSVTYLRALKAAEIVLNMQRSRTTIMIGVPRIFQLLGNQIQAQLDKLGPVRRRLVELAKPLARRSRRLARFAFGSLHARLGGHVRYFLVGGAPVHTSLIELFDELGIPMLQGYGLTETAPVISVCKPRQNRIGTAGRPLAGVEVRIDGNGSEPGEILVRGPNVMQGYFQNPEATAEAFRDGWFRTGDLGTLDDEGFLTIRGRCKSLIVTGSGKKICPEELETVIGRSELVRDVCVVARREADRSERPYAFVSPDRDAARRRLGLEPTDEQLFHAVHGEIKSLCSELSDYKKLCGFELSPDDLPKTATQKVRRWLLQRQLDERGQAPGHRVACEAAAGAAPVEASRGGSDA